MSRSEPVCDLGGAKRRNRMRAADVSTHMGTSAAGYGWLRSVTRPASAVLIARWSGSALAAAASLPPSRYPDLGIGCIGVSGFEVVAKFDERGMRVVVAPDQ